MYKHKFNFWKFDVKIQLMQKLRKALRWKICSRSIKKIHEILFDVKKRHGDDEYDASVAFNFHWFILQKGYRIIFPPFYF